MDHALLALRNKLEDFVVEALAGEWIGAGTNLMTGETDFSFDLSGKTYSVRIAELNLERKRNG